MSETTYVSTSELAKRFNISKGTIMNMVHANKIPFIKLGRIYRFDMKAVEASLAGTDLNSFDQHAAGEGNNPVEY